MAKKNFNSDRLFTATEPPKTPLETALTPAEEKVIDAINALAKRRITHYTPASLRNYVAKMTGEEMTEEAFTAAVASLKDNPQYSNLTSRIEENPKNNDPRINLRLTTENMEYIQAEKWHRRMSATEFINHIIEEYRINDEH